MSSQQLSEDEIERRINVLVFLPCATGSISVLSSSMMLFTIFRTRQLSLPSTSPTSKSGIVRRRRHNSQNHHKKRNDDNAWNDNGNRKSGPVLSRGDEVTATATTATTTTTTTNNNNDRSSITAAATSCRSISSSNNNNTGTTNKGILTTYHTLLSGVAIFDIIFSTALAFGPLLIPSETGFVGAYGSTASCEVQGFMFQLGMGSFAYTTCLMLYYLLVIRYGVQDKRMTKYVEPWLHAIPITFHVSTAVAGLFLDVFNPQAPLRCWVATYPTGCDPDWTATGDEDLDRAMECTRGAEYTDFFGTYLLVVPQLIYTTLCLLFLIVIAFTVWTQYRRSNRHRFSGSANTMSNSKRQMKMVITQCFLYGLAFLNVTVWGTMVTVLEDFADRQVNLISEQFWLGVLIHVFLPLQGLFFFLIYIRPRYLSLRRDDKDRGRWFAFYTAVFYPISRSGNRAGGSYDSNRRQQASRYSSSDAAVPPVGTHHHDKEIRKAGDGDYENGHAYNNKQSHDVTFSQNKNENEKQSEDFVLSTVKTDSFSLRSTTEPGKGS
mmetsp:Transcript_31275/g.75626  ORF Transcript_31275/g.75626 Transcript_31275/m.75626 type:complete len:549 (-) Transcript_31275:904-2550(-)